MSFHRKMRPGSRVPRAMAQWANATNIVNWLFMPLVGQGNVSFTSWPQKRNVPSGRCARGAAPQRWASASRDFATALGAMSTRRDEGAATTSILGSEGDTIETAVED